MKAIVRRILFPTDFSVPSKFARDYACAIAGPIEAELHVLHVVEEPLPTPRARGLWAAPPETLLPRLIHDAEEHLKSQLQDSGIRDRQLIFAVRVGHPVQEIMRYVDENQIDLIIIGTHGRTGMSHALIGSVAEKVVRMAKCPVLTVHPTGG